MGWSLKTRKGVNVKIHGQGGGWRGYWYLRAAPGEYAKTSHQRAMGLKLAAAAQECKGQGKNFRLCVSKKMGGGA